MQAHAHCACTLRRPCKSRSHAHALTHKSTLLGSKCSSACRGKLACLQRREGRGGPMRTSTMGIKTGVPNSGTRRNASKLRAVDSKTHTPVSSRSRWRRPERGDRGGERVRKSCREFKECKAVLTHMLGLQCEAALSSSHALQVGAQQPGGIAQGLQKGGR